MCRSRQPVTAVALFVLLALVSLVGSGRRHLPASKPQVQAGYARLPLSFEANQGQADGQVQFFSRGAGYSLFLTGTEAVLSLKRPAQVASGKAQARNPERSHSHTPTLPHPHTLRMRLAGANPKPEVRGVERLPGVSNYFLGNDPKQWRTNVPHYARVRYEEVYPGVDLVYYGNQQQLEYDFVVAPGADPDQVRLSFEGARKLEVDKRGDLLLHTAGGTVRQHRPVVYQGTSDRREPVEGAYRLLADGRIGFALGAYDVTRPLVIDPVLAYSTYLGGGSTDFLNGVAVDVTGAIYVSGYTESRDFPLVSALQPDRGGGDNEAFVAKLNPAGTALIYSTYLGGSGFENFEFGSGHVAVDAAGSAYVSGSTSSGDFPTTPSAFDTTFGGSGDGFVAKLSPAGDVLVYSSYLGGSGFDGVWDVTVDSSGTAYVTGVTGSADFPVTPGAADSSLGGSGDAFAARIGATGSSLLYATYLGGASEDTGYGVAIDSSGCAYLTGETTSLDFPVTPGSFDTTYSGSYRDAYVTKLNPSGTALIYATFVGAATGYSVAVDAEGSAYVTGRARAGFPTTPGAFDTSLGGESDAFALKLNPPGSALLYSTLLGGARIEGGYGIAVTSWGSAYVTGDTESPDFPVRQPLQPDLASGQFGDAFVTGLAPDGSALTLSTYLGGGTFDYGRDIALDASGAIYFGGSSDGGFPTANSLHPYIGGIDGFVAKIQWTVFPPPSSLTARALPGDPPEGPSRTELSWTDNSSGETSFRIERKLQRNDGSTEVPEKVFQEIGSTGANVTRFTDPAVPTDTVGGLGTWIYRVRAIGPAGHSGYTNNAIALRSPFGLRATALSETQVLLAWYDGNSIAPTFLVERKTGFPTDPGTYAEIVRTTEWSTVVTGLQPGGVYTFRVRGALLSSPAVYSDYSSEATVAMLAAPTGLSAAALSDSAVRLAWADNSTGEAGFRIERSTGTTEFLEVGSVGAGVTAYDDTGLVQQTAYRYRVRAFVREAFSDYSNVATATTYLLSGPTGLSSTPVSESQIRLTWQDTSTTETGFHVERRVGSAAFTRVATPGANVTSFVDSGLPEQGTYTYRVRAYGASGALSGYSNESTATTLLTPPAGLAGTPLSGRRIRLTWTDRSARESGYRIERKSGTGAFALVGTTGVNFGSFTDAGLTPLTSYTYRIRAVNAGNTSAYSNEAAVTTLADVPEAPSAAALTVSTGVVQLRWSDNSTNETGFKVERRSGTGSYSQIAVTGPDVLAFTDEGLTGSTYTYRVRAYNGNGDSLPSNEAQALLSAPAAPSNAVATAILGTRGRLTWQDNSSGEYGFRIERRTGTAGSFLEVRVVNPNVTELQETNLTPGTEYTYRVRAYNGLGTSAYSNEATVTPPLPPDAPSNLTATAVSSARIRLAWQDNATNEVDYRLSRRAGTGPWVEFRTLPANTTTFEDQGLVRATGYTYRVRARNLGGFSGYSNEATATTRP